ncbi:MAG TPA: ABC transporter substrate-binding protein [Chitinolyticbacter sp.]|nr:ABC transporter substrate-binding protein [Chitinolyticbacter sp.]
MPRKSCFPFAALRTLLPLLVVLTWLIALPSPHAACYRLARAEGRVVIYSVTDAKRVRPLIARFEARYPGVRVDYREMNSLALHRRFLDDLAQRRDGADLLWSSAMDLQIKLVNDGHAQAYRTAEAHALPDWAGYRDQAWATTFEPVVIAYHRQRLPEAQVPRSHLALTRLLERHPERWRGRLATYDIERSAVGFSFLAHDERIGGEAIWRLVRRLGEARVELHATTEAMVARLASGEIDLAYNAVGSYVLARAASDPHIGFVFPHDYTLVLSRIAVIPRAARRPHAAQLWLDFLLSREGQRLLSDQHLLSIRWDGGDELGAADLTRILRDSVKPIQPGPGLLALQDQRNRAALIARWRKELGRR